MCRKISERVAASGIEALSSAERRVLDLRIDGWTVPQIANELGLQGSAIDQRLDSATAKLCTGNRKRAVAIYAKWKISQEVQPGPAFSRHDAMTKRPRIELEAKTRGPAAAVLSEGNLLDPVVRGRIALSRGRVTDALACFDELLGPQAVIALTCRGHAFMFDFQYEKAEQAYRSAHSLSLEDPDIQESLALALYFGGKWVMAREVMEAVVAARSADMADTKVQTSCSNLAATEFVMGSYERALSRQRQVRRARGATFTRRHPEVLESDSDIAETLCAIGEYDQSIQLHREVLRLRRTKFGSGSHAWVESRNNLGRSLWSKGRSLLAGDPDLAKDLFTQSAKMHRQTLKTPEEILPCDDPLRLSVCSNLAASLHDLGNLVESRELNNQVWLSLTGSP